MSNLAGLPALASPRQIDCVRQLPARFSRALIQINDKIIRAGLVRSRPNAFYKSEGLVMVQTKIVRVELGRPNGRLREWEEAQSFYVGKVDRALSYQESVSCFNATERPFVGRLEFGALGEMLLCKLQANKYRFSRSFTTATPTMPAPMMLASVSRGSCRLDHCGRTCILTEGDWTLVDTKNPLEYQITSREIEAFVIMLPRPSDAEIADLCQERGVGRRSSGRLSRVLHAVVDESFSEMRRLPESSGRKLGATISSMAWDALREQMEVPSTIGRRDEATTRAKAFIEANLNNPELTIEKITHVCNISVRGLHRHFAEDPFGSVSRYIWHRRLVRCAEVLRDPSQAHRSITDICFSHGFISSSHFSRTFKDQFGVSPLHYRVGLGVPLRVIRDQKM